MSNKSLIRIFAFVLFFAAHAAAQTSAFVFQGKLNDGGLPANGTYQFTFTMYDGASGGNQIGQTIADLPATVSNGIFAVNLDFGANSFDGAARYIEVGVRISGAGQNYTILNPRQAVTSTPYAVKSLKSEQSVVADNSLNLGGIAANQYVITIDSRMSDARNPLPNSPNYIQNGTNSQSNSNFNVSGEGKANVFNATTQFNLNGNRILSGGNGNLFAGENTGTVNTGSSNSFVGAFAGQNNTTGNLNSFFGRNAGYHNTDGSFNSFFGTNAGIENTTGADNSFFGGEAGYLNTTGSKNSFFGKQAGKNTTNGSFNAFFGRSAGEANTTGSDNAFFGQGAGFKNTIGTFNSSLGSGAGINNTTGSNNTFAGYLAGSSNTTENDNTFIGYNSNGAAGITNSTAIGANSVVTTSNTMVLGTNAVTVKVPGNFNVAGTFSANALDSATVYKIGGNRVFHITGTDNTFVGFEAGNSVTSGGYNAFFGKDSGKGTTSGFNNSFFGAYAGIANTIGTNNSFFGANAGFSNNANSNSFFGSGSGFNNFSGANNSFFGTSSGSNNSSGQNNSFFGSKAGDSVTTGNNNTFVGALSGVSNSNGAGSNNTGIGYNTKFAAGVSNSIAIGQNVQVNSSNFVQIGNRTDGVYLGNVDANTVDTYTISAGSGNISTLDVGKITSSLDGSVLKATTITDLHVETEFVTVLLDAKEFRFRSFTSFPGIQPLPLCYAQSGLVFQLAKCPSNFAQTENQAENNSQNTIVLGNAIKEQQTQIAAQKLENQQLQDQIKQQQIQIDALKKLVCATNKDAEICQPDK